MIDFFKDIDLAYQFYQQYIFWSYHATNCECGEKYEKVFKRANESKQKEHFCLLEIPVKYLI